MVNSTNQQYFRRIHNGSICWQQNERDLGEKKNELHIKFIFIVLKTF